MSDQSIIGHGAQLAELKADMDSGNIAHAYLFAGAPHLGKMTIARWFATEMLFRDAGHEEKQKILHDIDRLIHPDLLVLDQLWIEEKCEDFEVIAETSNVPQQHRAKAGMRSDVIGIDDVRVIQERLHETGEGPWRFCIVRGIERMQEAAANAFLKILEEPPPGRVFIFTTESLTSILPTIVSRVRVMHFQRVADREMQALVKDEAEDDAKFILHLSQGAPGKAMRLLEDPDQLREEKLFHTQAITFWSATSLMERLKLLTPLLERGEEAERFMLHLALALREQYEDKAARHEKLMELVRGLETNAHRQLIAQRFALGIEN